MKAIFSVSPSASFQRIIKDKYGICRVSQREVAIYRPLVRVIDSGNDYFGNGKPYRGALLSYPTWGKLLNEATRLMKATGDYSHPYFEGFSLDKNQDEPGVLVIRLFMGS
jgi:hypothetical protein